MDYFYTIPAEVLLLGALTAAIILSALGQIIVHGLFKSQDFITHNEVGGIMITVAGSLYAVVLGFLTVVVWQHYIDARQLVVLESNADIDAWHTAIGLPAAVRQRVRNDMLNYAKIMAEREWSLMKHGGSDSDAAMISMDAIDATGTFTPADLGQSNAQMTTLHQLSAMHDARQQRIETNAAGVSGFEWLVLSIGAVCIICFCWLFGLKARMQLLMTSCVVTIIVSTLVLLFELQYPFRSDIGIGPDAWKSAISHIHGMQAGGTPPGGMPDMKM